MHRYGIYIHEEAMNFILSRRAADRELILRFFRNLSDDPFQTGAGSTTDAAERRNEVAFLGRFRIVFWADHPIKEVKVVKIEDIK